MTAPARIVGSSRQSGGPIRVLELRSVKGLGGGPEKTILHGAAMTDPARLKVTVCYIRDERDTDFNIDARAAALNLDYCVVMERSSADPAVWPALRQLVREKQIDIVHGHEYKTDLLAYLLARAEHVLPLTTVHGWSGHSFREQWVYYPIDKWLLRRFPVVIAVSDGVRCSIERAGVRPDRIQVLLNGIDHQVFKRDAAGSRLARMALSIGDGDLVIGAVGRLEWLKRFDLLIEAFARLRREWPQLRLLIAGEGGARRDLEAQIAALGLSESCRLVGHRPDVIEFYRALDVFVQSSATEGAPNVILEAMAMETPIVATDVGGTTELMRHGFDGLAVPAGDASGIANAIASVLHDPGAARLRAEMARRRIENELSFAARVERLNRLYESLVLSHPARAAGAVATEAAR